MPEIQGHLNREESCQKCLPVKPKSLFHMMWFRTTQRSVKQSVHPYRCRILPSMETSQCLQEDTECMLSNISYDLMDHKALESSGFLVLYPPLASSILYSEQVTEYEVHVLPFSQLIQINARTHSTQPPYL